VVSRHPAVCTRPDARDTARHAQRRPVAVRSPARPRGRSLNHPSARESHRWDRRGSSVRRGTWWAHGADFGRGKWQTTAPGVSAAIAPSHTPSRPPHTPVPALPRGAEAILGWMSFLKNQRHAGERDHELPRMGPQPRSEPLKKDVDGPPAGPGGRGEAPGHAWRERPGPRCGETTLGGRTGQSPRHGRAAAAGGLCPGLPVSGPWQQPRAAAPALGPGRRARATPVGPARRRRGPLVDAAHDACGAL